MSSSGIIIYKLDSFFSVENLVTPIVIQELSSMVGNVVPSADGSRIFGAAQHAGLYQVVMPVNWAPAYILQTFSQTSCYRGTAGFFPLVSANPLPVTVQWYRSGTGPSTLLSNGPTGWGSTITIGTDGSLTISDLRSEDRREYFCITTNSCGSTFSFRASINFCLADFNCDGAVDPDDLADYIGTYFADLPGSRSDFNADGLTDPDDLADYITAFFSGCT